MTPEAEACEVIGQKTGRMSSADTVYRESCVHLPKEDT